MKPAEGVSPPTFNKGRDFKINLFKFSCSCSSMKHTVRYLSEIKDEPSKMSRFKFFISLRQNMGEKKKSVPLPSLTQFSDYPAVCHPPLAWVLLHTNCCLRGGRARRGRLPSKGCRSPGGKERPAVHHCPDPIISTPLPPLPTPSRHRLPCR